MRSRALLTAVVAVVVVAGTPVAAVPPPPSPLAALDAEVEHARREFEIPGLALAVVKDGRVLLAKGYGARDRTVPDAFVGFALRPDGSIEQFKMAAISPAADFSYDYQDLLITPVPEK